MHAGGLASNLLRLRPDLRVNGVGGARLRESGAELIQDTVSKARFGLTSFVRAGEVWSMLKALRRRWESVGPPKLVVACDSWTMNKHVLALAKDFGSRGMYYVSPQVWASREGRVKRLAELTDAVACILPFEEAWLRERGVNATFVGHPLFDHLPDPIAPPTPRYPDRPPRIALNAGSRVNTAKANLRGLAAAARELSSLYPGATFVSPAVPVTAPLVQGALGSLAEVVVDRFDETVAGCDLALTVSGTATLQTAAHGVPMVVVYHGSRLLWETIGKRIVKTRTFALVNLLHPRREHVADEIIPWNGDPAPVVASARRLLDDPEALRRQRRQLEEVVTPLRRRGAGESAAKIALSLIEAG